jgi:hypothetical protein
MKDIQYAKTPLLCQGRKQDGMTESSQLNKLLPRQRYYKILLRRVRHYFLTGNVYLPPTNPELESAQEETISPSESF